METEDEYVRWVGFFIYVLRAWVESSGREFGGIDPLSPVPTSFSLLLSSSSFQIMQSTSIFD